METEREREREREREFKPPLLLPTKMAKQNIEVKNERWAESGFEEETQRGCGSKREPMACNSRMVTLTE